MNDIDQLLDGLNAMAPITGEFRKDLSPILHKKSKRNNYVFLKPGGLARKAWQLLSGFVIALGSVPEGKDVVMDIYFQGRIFTDMLSFFHKHPIRYKFIAIGEVNVLELKKSDFVKLAKYPETTKLVQYIVLTEKQIDQARAEMFLLPVKERIIRYFEQYPIADLADEYYASFLRIPLDEYKDQKVMLLTSGEIKLSTENIEQNNQRSTIQMVYEVKAYLTENYTQPDIDDTVKIAALFNTTKKTLTRMFVKTFGITVHKLILKLKMEKAYSLLVAENKMNLHEVCDLVGYNDIYNFSRNFKKYYGFSTKKAAFKEQ